MKCEALTLALASKCEALALVLALRTSGLGLVLLGLVNITVSACTVMPVVPGLSRGFTMFPNTRENT